jgi:hypothetical protein
VRVVFGARRPGGAPAGSVIDADFLFLAGAARPDEEDRIPTLPDGRGPPPRDPVGVGGMLKRALCRAAGVPAVHSSLSALVACSRAGS